MSGVSKTSIRNIIPHIKKTHLGEITSDGRFPVEEKITHRMLKNTRTLFKCYWSLNS